MRSLFLITIVINIVFCYYANAQLTPAIQITYDAAGNRVSKEQVMVLQKQVESEPIKLNTFTRSQCSVKPNPIKERAIVTVQSDMADAVVTFTLYDVKGNILFTTQGMTGENEIDMAALSNSAYILRVKVDSETSDLTIIKRE